MVVVVVVDATMNEKNPTDYRNFLVRNEEKKVNLSLYTPPPPPYNSTNMNEQQNRKQDKITKNINKQQ